MNLQQLVKKVNELCYGYYSTHRTVGKLNKARCKYVCEIDNSKENSVKLSVRIVTPSNGMDVKQMYVNKETIENSIAWTKYCKELIPYIGTTVPLVFELYFKKYG